MVKQELMEELFAIKAPDDVEREVKINKLLYPRISNLKTQKQLDERIIEIKKLLAKTKSSTRIQRLRNELLIISGKLFTLWCKDSGSTLGYFKNFAVCIAESGPRPTTKEEKESHENEVARTTAMYYYTGGKVREVAKARKEEQIQQAHQ